MNAFPSINEVKKMVNDKSVTFTDLCNEYKYISCISCKPNAFGFPETQPNTIIDPDKSVKWNMEEANRRITKYEAERERLMHEQYEILETIKYGIISKATTEKNLTMQSVNSAWEHARNIHELGYNNLIDEFIELFIDLLDLCESVASNERVRK